MNGHQLPDSTHHRAKSGFWSPHPRNFAPDDDADDRWDGDGMGTDGARLVPKRSRAKSKTKSKPNHWTRHDIRGGLGSRAIRLLSVSVGSQQHPAHAFGESMSMSVSGFVMQGEA